jgi:hypothetical protein
MYDLSENEGADMAAEATTPGYEWCDGSIIFLYRLRPIIYSR